MKSRKPPRTRAVHSKGSKLPEIEELTAYLAAAPSGVKLREIARAFGIPPQGRAALRKLLSKISFEADSTASKAGTILLFSVCQIDDEGIAWAQSVSPDDADPLPISLSSSQRTPAISQRFIGRIMGEEAHHHVEVLRILGASAQTMFGRLISSKSGWLFETAQKGASQLISAIDVPELSLEENCLVEVIADNSNGRVRRVKPVRNLGSIFHPDAFASLAIAEFDLPSKFSEEAIKQAETATLSKLKTAEDITHIPIVTIDGEDAKDFDDGVFATPLDDGNWRLIVAIQM